MRTLGGSFGLNKATLLSSVLVGNACKAIAINSLKPSRHLPAQSQQKNTRTRCEICSKLTIKIPERRQWQFKFEQISQFWNYGNASLNDKISNLFNTQMMGSRIL